MKKNLSRILSYTASAVAMSAILAVTVPADLFGQNGGAFAEGGSDTCYYGEVGCTADENGTHNHNVTIGEGCSQQTISGGTFTGKNTITVKSGGEITGGSFGTESGSQIMINVEHGGEITEGTFGGVSSSAQVTVTGGRISGGTFYNAVTVGKDGSNHQGEITGGTFIDGNIIVEAGGVISGDTVASGNGSVTVKEDGTITYGTFSKKVILEGGTISGGKFNNKDTCVAYGTIEGGIFEKFKQNGGTISGGTFSESCGEINNCKDNLHLENSDAKITGGTFYCEVINGNEIQNPALPGKIENGFFWKDVTNSSNGTISKGSFYGTVTNAGKITGGWFTNPISGNPPEGEIEIWYVPYPASKPASGASEAAHTHSYSWVTVQEATAEQDGIEEYRCSCGDVQERCVIPSSMVFVKGLYGAVKDAPQNGTATFDSGRLYTISDYVIKKLAERSDVTTVITFEYQNQSYQMTIPAGADYTALLADQDYFYGYFYFANAVGAAIEAL